MMCVCSRVCVCARELLVCAPPPGPLLLLASSNPSGVSPSSPPLSLSLRHTSHHRLSAPSFSIARTHPSSLHIADPSGRWWGGRGALTVPEVSLFKIEKKKEPKKNVHPSLPLFVRTTTNGVNKSLRHVPPHGSSVTLNYSLAEVSPNGLAVVFL